MNAYVTYFLAILSVLLMLMTIARMYTSHPLTRVRWIFFTIGNFMVFLFVYLAGTWAYVSFYVQWLFLPAWIAAVLFSARRLTAIPWHGGVLRLDFWIGRAFVYLVAGILLWQYFMGATYEGNAVNIRFPFHKGRYYIMQGGGSLLTNFFHRGYDIYSHHSFDAYAVDIGKLNSWHARAWGVSPRALSAYAIYGDTIFSPVSGRVIQSLNNVSQNIPNHFNTDTVHGNHVIIQSNGFRLILAHMQPGKVFLKTGDSVRTGQPVGIVGNSGFSAEPHLHVNAIRGYKKDSLYSGYSVPILFDGHFYELNEKIRIR